MNTLRQQADSLAGLVSEDSFSSEVKQWLVESVKSVKVGLACSGGKDSVFLTLWAWALFPELRERFVILHFDHQLRGAESDGDAAFVQRLASELGVPFESSKRHAEAGERINENLLRESRIQFFLDSGCGAILFGHHLDDIAETMLMRLARGSGSEGLSAPRAVRKYNDSVVFLRPLLTLRSEEIKHTLKHLTIEWREDSSNQSDDFFRNRLRNGILPLLEDASPSDFAHSVARSRMLLEEDAEALKAWQASVLPLFKKNETLDLTLFSELPKALWRRGIQAWLQAQGHGAALSARAFEQLLEHALMEAPLAMSVAEDITLNLSEKVICLKKKEPLLVWEPIVLSLGESVQLPNGRHFSCHVLALDDSLRKKILSGQINQEKEAYIAWDRADSKSCLKTITLRQWLPGDTYRALGAPGKRKLQDIFVDKKMDAPERKSRPIVCLDEGQIVWCPGLPPANLMKITHETASALLLTYGDT